jgi:hypothetical protein
MAEDIRAMHNQGRRLPLELNDANASQLADAEA